MVLNETFLSHNLCQYFHIAYISRRRIDKKADLGDWASSLRRAGSAQIGEQQPIYFCNQAMDSKHLGIIARPVTWVIQMLGLAAIVLVLV